jgi:cell division protein FtsW
MSTETTTPKKSKSLKNRRIEVLRRTGSITKNKIALEKPTPAFYWILIVVSLFVMLGLVMVLSSSSVTSLHTGSSAWSMFFRQLVWVALGGFAMWVTYSVPYSTWRDPFILGAAAVVIVTLNLLVLAKGQVIGGAKAWLDLGPFRFQPSEFMKVVSILFAANLLAKRHRAIAIRSMVLWPMLAVVGVTAGLCGLQRDYGSALIFAGTMLAMLQLAGVPKRQILGVSLGFFGAGVLVMTYADRASERMMAFMNLEGTKEDVGYQVYQALLSIANGGWTGTGIGAGTSKWGYVPLAYSDFIFSVIAEEMGILGTLIVIGGFLLLVLLGVQVALTSTDMYGAFLAGGIASWFGIQAIVNIGGVTGTLPMTGLTLPFLSYGGSSMIASMAAVGLLLNVARFARQ